MVRVPFRAAADRVRHRLSQLARPKPGRSNSGSQEPGGPNPGSPAPGRPPRRAPAGSRPSRTGAAVPGDLTAPARHRPFLRALGMLAVVVLGAWLGLLAVGSIRTPVGPMDTNMTLRPSLTGGSKINVAPLGALELDSHSAPLRLDVDVDRLDPERSQALVDWPERFSHLQDEVTRDVAAGTRELAVRSCVAVVSGAAALGLVVYRRPRRALAAGGIALTLLAASGVSAYATWNPKSVLEPKFSGLLSSAPSLVGDARSIVTEFDIYQRELARLVTNVTKLYDATSTLPVYQPDPGTIRVLHVSDIHLNPAAWHIIASLVEQYEIDVIVDSGDTMDHGSAPENSFLDPVRDLGAPYVWVRGNHDSPVTQAYLEKFENVRVLDGGAAVNIGGLRIAGTGDASFTPDRTGPGGNKEAARLEGMRLASALRDQQHAGTPVDIAVAHDPNTARETDGTVPLVLSGHYHRRINEQLKLGTRLKVEGSTGGGGLRAVQNEKPEKVHASVLYMDRSTRRLQAWDEITLGGLGLTTAEVSRHLPEENLKEGGPVSPTPSPSSSPSAGASPGRPAGRPTPSP
ncbi:metallophosphoesterase [Streptomyces sp. V2I9]|uniref:metallophosphoesterase family protein n=1 Tax=Streptomyces sp. V2I9 TaxID=3042304 RepID=UPI00277EAD6A|nr:metallophosphoesterase [Streptomyces sp. V2I9]MDQ0985436.1 putative MPP superfamily phosphohydrolase [Streptomyces sp. V2I9]